MSIEAKSAMALCPRPDPRVHSGVAEASDCNPYLFVVGCPRSGTTLLQRILDHHPFLTVANDTHFIPRAIRGYQPRKDLALTDELVERVRAYRRFHRLGLSPEAVCAAVAGSRTYSEFVSGLYAELARQKGKPLAGEKTPDYVRYLPVLAALFPAARFVHILRDGRDVALSTLEWAREERGPGRFALWRENPVAVCALWWRWQVGTGREDAARLGPCRYHEVSYEELVARPEATCRRLTAFLQLPYVEEMLKYHEGKQRDEPGLSAKSAWLQPTPGLRDWRTQMSGKDRQLFAVLAGDLLADLGYELEEPISAATAREADRCREWWKREMARRRAKEWKGPRQ